jgi:hypothetical protein
MTTTIAIALWIPLLALLAYVVWQMMNEESE